LQLKGAADMQFHFWKCKGWLAQVLKNGTL